MNLFLSAVVDILVVFGIYTITESEEKIGLICLIIGLTCLAFLIVRNLKIESIPKIIAFTLLQILVGSVAIIVLIIYFAYCAIEGNESEVSKTNYSTPDYTSSNNKNTESAYDYTSAQDELARSYGFADSEHARLHGIDTKTML